MSWTCPQVRERQMKVHFDIECTPEDARTFLGLPDLKPVHDIYVDRMQALIRDGLTVTDFERMMNSWSPPPGGGLALGANAIQPMPCMCSSFGTDFRHDPRPYPHPPHSPLHHA